MKDAYYFAHDANAKDDPKCVILIDELGLEGYGIYWMLIETLRAEPDYKAPLRMLKGLARKYNTSDEKVLTVVSKYDLFSRDEDYFWSESLLRRMEVYRERKQKLREAGRKGGKAKAMLKPGQSDAKAMLKPGSSDPLALKESKVKESKVKESKVKESKERVLRARASDSETQKAVARDQWTHYKSEFIRTYLEIFKRPISDYESQLIAKHVKSDIDAWRHACELWLENGFNVTNIPDLIKKYKSMLELDGNEIQRATNIPQSVKLNLERMRKEGNISEQAIQKVLAGKLTIKSNPQGFLQLVEVK